MTIRDLRRWVTSREGVIEVRAHIPEDGYFACLYVGNGRDEVVMRVARRPSRRAANRALSRLATQTIKELAA